ncbi:MAG: 4-hydroxy-3-methylbut-2-enyl diphosphate reductase [Lachnospiraceae bacterium]|nr:4-hydroxy-3-methylbut-2-enyl diphosphate reductase [Lachnospiraceae bacterium]
MEIILAKSAGFCFGVRRAVDMARALAKERTPVYTYGPIIHNENVVADLEEKGIFSLDTVRASYAGGDKDIIIRSHGVAKSVLEDMKQAGNRITDATCPFVKKIHKIVSEHSAKGEQIVIFGSKSHPEVEGIMGWSDGPCIVISDENEADDFTADNGKELCIVAQTTFLYKKFQVMVEIIQKKGYNVYAFNTICNATEERQREAAQIASQVDVMLVIGGRNSSNSAKLYQICKKLCPRTFFLQTADDLDLSDFLSIDKIGITAGASTPNYIIKEVQTKCQK